MKPFDFYEPVPELEYNGYSLRGWKGTDNVNALLLWKQGEAAPVDQLVDEDMKLPDEVIKAYRLENGTFRIFTDNPSGKGRIYASCTVKKGKWVSTKLA